MAHTFGRLCRQCYPLVQTSLLILQALQIRADCLHQEQTCRQRRLQRQQWFLSIFVNHEEALLYILICGFH